MGSELRANVTKADKVEKIKFIDDEILEVDKDGNPTPMVMEVRGNLVSLYVLIFIPSRLKKCPVDEHIDSAHEYTILITT